MKQVSIFPIGISGPWSYRSDYILAHFLERMYISGHRRTPMPIMRPNRTGSVARRDALGGIVNDYYRLAA
jgi:hypothetical protein